jgi:hypothetical protein
MSSCYLVPAPTPGKQFPAKADGVSKGRIQEYTKMPSERERKVDFSLLVEPFLVGYSNSSLIVLVET